jgi:hypothetical protein
MRGNDEKISIVIKKEDMVDKKKIMRVYGELMWYIGKVIKNKEVESV